MVFNAVERHNGRIWSWEGDGGLLVFHIKDSVNDAILTAVEIISSMVVLNASGNYLDGNLRIRIGISSGTARYKKEVNAITSDAIEKTKEIEKHYTHPMTISISKHTFQHMDMILRNFFETVSINGQKVFMLRFPIRKPGS